MPAPNQSTFDGNPNTSPPTTTPYRPGVADFNGAALANDPTNPPDPETMPTAELLNTNAFQHVSAGKMIAVAMLSVNASGTPSIQSWSTAANNLAGNPFTLTRNAAGDYSITWAANTFPAVAVRPQATLNVQLGAHNYAVGAINITNGVRVTTTQDGALTDLNFTVWIF